METKLERIADKSAHEPKPEFTSLYHLINKAMGNCVRWGLQVTRTK